jgi:hypothetical protein
LFWAENVLRISKWGPGFEPWILYLLIMTSHNYFSPQFPHSKRFLCVLQWVGKIIVYKTQKSPCSTIYPLNKYLSRARHCSGAEGTTVTKTLPFIGLTYWT